MENAVTQTTLEGRGDDVAGQWLQLSRLSENDLDELVREEGLEQAVFLGSSAHERIVVPGVESAWQTGEHVDDTILLIGCCVAGKQGFERMIGDAIEGVPYDVERKS